MAALTIAQLRTDLDQVRDKIREVIGTGAQYSLVGSHSATQQTLTDLRREEGRIAARLRRVQGYISRTKPAFGGGNGVETADL